MILVGVSTGTSGTEDFGGGDICLHQCTRDAEDVFFGQVAVTTGSATSIKVKLRGTQAAGTKLQAAIYSSDTDTPVLLGQTAEYTTTGSEADGEIVTMNLVSPVAIVSGTAYILSLWAGGWLNVYRADSSPAGDKYEGVTYVSDDWSTVAFVATGSGGSTVLVLWADGAGISRSFPYRRGVPMGVLLQL